MYTFFMILHVIVSLLLCIVVLMQSGKSGGLAGAFGGGGGLPQQMFGSRAMATALNKMTVYLAAGFFLTSAVLFGLTADRTAKRAGGAPVSEQTSEPVGGGAPITDGQ
ncbi:MAG: preprotein translocase subunit SecG [bacterium]|nr:preprotein translocase subunit SecG [bacterium]